MKTAVQTETAPAAIGPYSQAIKVDFPGRLVITSGQLPMNPATNMFPEGIQAQTRQSLKNCEAVLSAAGRSMKDVIKTTVFLSEMSHFAAMNEVYAEFFQETPPARSAVEVARLPKDALIEIECIAVQ